MNKKLTTVDILLFESIYIDQLNIYINKDKIELNSAGLYNQICSYFKNKSLIDKFNEWIYLDYEDSPKNWEDSIRANRKDELYSQLFKIKYNNSYGIEFYVLNGCSFYEYLTSTNKYNWVDKVIKYLRFGRYTNQIVNKLSIQHPLDMTNKQIYDGIKQALKNNIIGEVPENRLLTQITFNDKEVYKRKVDDYGYNNEL